LFILGGVFGATGAGGGALVGAGIPRWRPPTRLAFHERGGAGPIGSLALAVGVTSSLGEDRATSGAVALRFLTRFGPYLAAGPELGYYHFGRTQLMSASGPGPTIARGARQLGIATVLAVPADGAFQGQLLVGLGLLSHRWDHPTYDHHFGGSAGLAGQWRLSTLFALSGEARLWTVLDDQRGSGGGHRFATLTTGLAAHW
jgi:hypothetical protein